MADRKRGAGRGAKAGGNRKGGGEDPQAVKVRLLTRKNPSEAKGTAHSAVIKDGDVFLVAREDGSIPFEGKHGYGLYFHDCRFLDGFRIEVNGHVMEALSATSQEGFQAVFEWTNPALESRGRTLPEHTLGMRLTRLVSHGEGTLRDELEIRNFGSREAHLEIAIFLRAGFADVFNIRGLDGRRPGKASAPAWRGRDLVFAYRGADGLDRVLTARFNGRFAKAKGPCARFRLRLKPEQGDRLEWIFRLEEAEAGKRPGAGKKPLPDVSETRRAQAEERALHTSRGSEVACDHETLRTAIRQSLVDLRSLQSELDGQRFFAAGIPWFATLFGRDSVTACLQTLAFDPDSTLGTLRLLARRQGTKVDPWTDEEPGRILHEFRRGELARAGLIPYTPFYGTVDTTPLFLILLAEHAGWSGSLDAFRELRGAVDLALGWMDRHGDANGDGYLEYPYPPVGAQINLGWKDSADAIVTGSGALAKSPISLVEAQAYAFRARLGIAGLLRRNGEGELAEELEAEAAGLRARFNRDFWMREERYYALALHGRGEAANVAASNPGHALWCGIVPRSRAAAVRDRLLAGDLYSGWGIRTLSSGARAYNPVSYHLGSVWPHDNAFAAAGLRDYGFHAEALRIFEGLLDAAEHFPERRLPELFCGFSRAEFPQPVSYPIACHPQAWASGALPFLLATVLGLKPDGFARRLRIARPMLPAGCTWLEWRRLRVGQASVDLRFERHGGSVRARVLSSQGEIEVDAD